MKTNTVQKEQMPISDQARSLKLRILIISSSSCGRQSKDRNQPNNKKNAASKL